MRNKRSAKKLQDMEGPRHKAPQKKALVLKRISALYYVLGIAGISFCRNGIFAVAQSTILSPDKPNSAAVAPPGSSVKFTGIRIAPSICVPTAGCANQYANVAAFTKNRIASVRAFTRNHCRRLLVPDMRDAVERLARFKTCKPCPAAKIAHNRVFSGICNEIISVRTIPEG